VALVSTIQALAALTLHAARTAKLTFGEPTALCGARGACARRRSRPRLRFTFAAAADRDALARRRARIAVGLVVAAANGSVLFGAHLGTSATGPARVSRTAAGFRRVGAVQALLAGEASDAATHAALGDRRARTGWLLSSRSWRGSITS